MTPSACQITFGGMDAVEVVKVEVRAWLEKLGPLTTAMMGARVVIETVEERRKERRYSVRMELTMPEGLVVVGLDHPSNGAHEDIYVAVRNAFRAARRQLEIYFQSHTLPPVPPADTGAVELADAVQVFAGSLGTEPKTVESLGRDGLGLIPILP
jgi:Sigma 54 modulation protein / S30EA ribosomal protein